MATWGEARLPTTVQLRAVRFGRTGNGPRGTKAADSGSRWRSSQ
jgi:hypothetical protein